MGRVAAIGEAARVQGLSLAGVMVLPAERPEQVRQRCAELPGEVTVVILTARAAQAAGPLRAGLLTVVMPP